LSDFSYQAAMFGRLKPFSGVQFVKETLQCPVLEESGSLHLLLYV